MGQLISAWEGRDLRGVQQQLAFFDSRYDGLDYLIIERPEAQWLAGQPFDYELEASIGNFEIYRREHLRRHARSG